MQLFDFTKIDLFNFFFRNQNIPSSKWSGIFRLQILFFVQKNINKTRQGLFVFSGFIHKRYIAPLNSFAGERGIMGKDTEGNSKTKEKQLYCQTSEQTILTQVPANTSYTLSCMSCPVLHITLQIPKLKISLVECVSQPLC